MRKPLILVALLLLLPLFSLRACHAASDKLAIKIKADKAVSLLKEQMDVGRDVSAIVPKMKRVKALADTGKWEQVDVLLDEILRAFQEMKKKPIPTPDSTTNEFINNKKVHIRGYTGDVMELFITRDSRYLFFNSMKRGKKEKDIFYAERIDDYTFTFKGEVKNVNTSAADGVPTMDNAGNFFYVSCHAYRPGNLVTMYRGTFNRGVVTNIKPLVGLSLNKPGWLNMDSEISADGKTLYSTQTYFGDGSPPTKSYFFYARKGGGKFIPQKDSAKIFKEINQDKVVYGATISTDECEILYTRLVGTRTESLRATRPDKQSPFGKPKVISAITGFSEAPALTGDGKLIYYHKQTREDGVFSAYALHRKSEGTSAKEKVKTIPGT